MTNFQLQEKVDPKQEFHFKKKKKRISFQNKLGNRF